MSQVLSPVNPVIISKTFTASQLFFVSPSDSNLPAIFWHGDRDIIFAIREVNIGADGTRTTRRGNFQLDTPTLFCDSARFYDDVTFDGTPEFSNDSPFLCTGTVASSASGTAVALLLDGSLVKVTSTRDSKNLNGPAPRINLDGLDIYLAQYKTEPVKDKWMITALAEDAYAISPLIARFTPDGVPTDIDDRSIMYTMLLDARDMRARISELESRLDAATAP